MTIAAKVSFQILICALTPILNFIFLTPAFGQAEPVVKLLRQKIAFDSGAQDSRVNPYDPEHNRINSQRIWYVGTTSDRNEKRKCSVEVLSVFEAFKMGEIWKESSYFVTSLWREADSLSFSPFPLHSQLGFFKGYDRAVPLVEERAAQSGNGSEIVINHRLAFTYSQASFSEASSVNLVSVRFFESPNLNSLNSNWSSCEDLTYVGTLVQEDWENLGDWVQNFYLSELQDDRRLGVLHTDSCAPNFQNPRQLVCWLPNSTHPGSPGEAVILESQSEAKWKVISSCLQPQNTQLNSLLLQNPVCKSKNP